MKLAMSFLVEWLSGFEPGAIRTYKDLCVSLKYLTYHELSFHEEMTLRAFKKLNKKRRQKLLRRLLAKKLDTDCLKLLSDARHSGLIQLSDRDERNYAAQELINLGYLRKQESLRLPFSGGMIYYALTQRGWDL